MLSNIKENIQPISDFRKSSAFFLKKLKQEHNPIILTQRGRSIAVLLDIDTYEQLEYEKHFRASYFRGVKDIEQEKTISHNQVKQTIRQAIRRSLKR
ncbi:MAG: type II toxin-antitoxin system Phd/YefM family antitoxin [Elusimicrobiota bacterium]